GDSIPDEIGYGDEYPSESVQPDLSMLEDMSASQHMDPQMEAQVIPVGYPATDWTAASVTVLVQP
ncbi:MAG: hypothetical protein JSU60_07320, partial [Nitrospirota bacterium]